MSSVKSGDLKELGAGSVYQGQEKGEVQMEEDGGTVCPTRPVITRHLSLSLSPVLENPRSQARLGGRARRDWAT